MKNLLADRLFQTHVVQWYLEKTTIMKGFFHDHEIRGIVAENIKFHFPEYYYLTRSVRQKLIEDLKNWFPELDSDL